MSTVSFGKKIPIIQCNIKDNKLDEFVSATFFEVDCKDMKDINEIYNLKGNWGFRRTIANDMERTHNLLAKNQNHRNPYSFYILQKNGGEIVGLSEVKNFYPALRLEYIESEPQKNYKYVGQTMLASLTEIVKQKKLKHLYIPVPMESSVSFYKDTCGFRTKRNSIALLINLNRAKKLKKQVETNTHAPLINIQG